MEEAPKDPSPASKADGLTLSAEEMRSLGYQAVDALVERWSTLRDQPAWRGAKREDLEGLLREDAPEDATPMEDVMRRAVDQILPVAARVDHPRFFAFVPGAPVWSSALAGFLSNGFNIFQGTWLGSSGPSFVELVVLEWFREWLGMPAGSGGLMTSGGSAANLDALMAVRERFAEVTHPVVYMSDQAHSSLAKAARVVGLGPAGVRMVPTDASTRFTAERVREVIAEDRARGRTPICVCATAGATNTGTVDPLSDLGALCREEGLWLHVDAAYGGFAVLTPEGRSALQGIGEADSITLDPHKWLFQSFETGCLMVRDVPALERGFSAKPEYLQDTEWGDDHPNFGDRGLQLSRTFRALKVWMSVQTHGLAAFRAAISRSMDLAVRAQAYIDAAPDLELLSPAALGIVCYRYSPQGSALSTEQLGTLNERIQDAVVDDGYAMVSSTRLEGAYALRLCIMNYQSTWEDVEGTLSLVQAMGARLCD